MKIAKWGNSLAVRLPLNVIKALDLAEGDEIELVVSERKGVDVAKLPSPTEVLRQLQRFRGKLPKDFRFDREEANARR